MGSSIVNNFDQLYSQVCDNLRHSNRTNTVLETIESVASDFDRIKFILNDNKKIINLFSQNITNCFQSKDDKNTQKQYESGCISKSLPAINQALRLCAYEKDLKLISNIQDIISTINLDKVIELSSLEQSNDNNTLISEIFYERSEIFFQRKLFDACIKDIFRSINFGHNANYELILRLGTCFKNLNYTAEAKIIFQHSLQLLRKSSLGNEFKSKETMQVIKFMKEIQQIEGTIQNENNSKPHFEQTFDLFDGESKTLIGTSNALELRYNEQRGRHMIATKTIPPGSTIIVENPYAWSLSKKNYPFICQNCTEPADNGIPCSNCSSVMFCSEKCQEVGEKLFHKSECKILRLLDSSEKLGKMAVICFRSIAQTPLQILLKEYQKNTLCEGHLLKEPIMGFNEDDKLDSSNYSSVFAQTTNSYNRHAGDLLKRTYSAIYITLCLCYVGYFGNNDDIVKCKTILSEDEELVAAILLRHLQSVSCNGYGINHISKADNLETLEIDEIGGATYPIISTTNHSCNCNVYRINVGKACVVKTLQEIVEGSEILDSYGPLYTIASKEDRVKELETQYLFKCSCEACENNWPTFKDLRNPNYKNKYKCPNCKNGILNDGTSKDKKTCSSCGRVTDFKKVQKLLKTAQEKHLSAKEIVLKRQQTKNLDLQKAISNYILTLQKVIVSPCKEIIEAQEILKLHWNLCIKRGDFPK